jgi:predicted nucleotidyltransferase
MQNNHMEKSDHDILVKLEENVRLNFENLGKAVQELRDGMADRMKKVEADMYHPNGLMSKIDERIDCIEKRNSNQKVLVGIYSAIGASLVALMLYHLFYQ